MTDQAERLEARDLVRDLDEQISGDLPDFDRRPLPGLLAHRPNLDIAGLLLLLAVVGFLWGRAASMSLWLDEGISIGVASHPLRTIPDVLLQDGAPPLYYLLLNVWTSVLGVSNTSVHALSLLFALGTLPAAFWAGWILFGRRTGWMCALVVAINPFVAYFATETRMYSLAVLLGLLSTTCFLKTFVFSRRRYLPWFVICQALLLYTHNWGLLLAAGAAVALLPLWLLTDDRRRLVIDAVWGFGGLGLLYAPWVASITYQISQHLQPWGRKGDLVWVRDDVARMLGGPNAFVVLGLGAGVGLAALLQGRWRSREAMAIAVLAIVPAVGLAAGWTASVWAYRYLAVFVGPLVLLAAIGLARSGRAGLAALGVAAFITAPIAVRGPAYQKSNAEAVSKELSPKLARGDLVILPDIQMVPLLAHYLPDGLRYATTSGLVPDEDVVDWRNTMERLINDEPAVTLPPLIDAVPPGGHVVVMCPPQTGDSNGLAQAQDRISSDAEAAPDGAGPQEVITPIPAGVAFHPLILLRCRQTEDVVASRSDLTTEVVLTQPADVRFTPVRARLLNKASTV